MGIARWAGAVIVLAVAAACETTSADDGGGQTDAGTADGQGTADATTSGSDAATGDAETDGDAASNAAVHDPTDASKWSKFDLASLGETFAFGTNFFGGAFDGRYVYLVPNEHSFLKDAGAGKKSGVVVRYDTQNGAFTSAAVWSSFDAETTNANAKGFTCSAFDGRYLYLAGIGYVTRYDTQAPFDAGASWVTMTAPSSDIFSGMAFDGRYLYLPSRFEGPVVRIDTQSTFTDAASWKTFSPWSASPGTGRHEGAVFDGRYVQFGPLNGSTPNGIFPRYDTQAPFDSAASWTFFDLGTIDPKAKAFAGGTSDGRFVYFAPYYESSFLNAVVSRYDTQGAWDAASSWTTFDARTLSPEKDAFGLIGAVFDGRRVFFVPFFASALYVHDTQAGFGDAASWKRLDLKTLDPKAYRYHGGVFDGRFLYLVPAEQSVVLRFDAKTPPSMPASYKGSFY